MKTVRPAALALSVALGALLSGCSWSIPFEQTVSIALTKDGGPYPGVSLRYYDKAGCTGQFVAATTDLQGKAAVTRTTKRGRYVVLLETASLCVQDGTGFVPIWSETVDPPDHLWLACGFADGGKWTCTS